MNTQLIIWGLLAAALATGLVAGVFLTFSDFVMKSLRASQPAAGSEAMQVINRKVYSSLFMVLLIGMVPVSAAIATYAYAFLPSTVSTYLIAADLLYVVGTFLVTLFGNVPMNHRLEAMPDGGPEAQNYWPSYVSGWTLWNHVRTLTSASAAFCYMIAVVTLAQTA